MKRRQFLKFLGIGIASVVIAPTKTLGSLINFEEDIVVTESITIAEIDKALVKYYLPILVDYFNRPSILHLLKEKE